MQDERFMNRRFSNRLYTPDAILTSARNMLSPVGIARAGFDSYSYGTTMSNSGHSGTHYGDGGINERTTAHFVSPSIRSFAVQDLSRLPAGFELELIKGKFQSAVDNIKRANAPVTQTEKKYINNSAWHTPISNQIALMRNASYRTFI